jgi:hypothetical protein
MARILITDPELDAMLAALLPRGGWAHPPRLAEAIEVHFGAWVDLERLARVTAPRIDIDNFIDPEEISAPSAHDRVRVARMRLAGRG